MLGTLKMEDDQPDGFSSCCFAEQDIFSRRNVFDSCFAREGRPTSLSLSLSLSLITRPGLDATGSSSSCSSLLSGFFEEPWERTGCFDVQFEEMAWHG
jgi:hypothetical protein